MVAMDNEDLQKALIASWQIFIEMDLKRIIRAGPSKKNLKRIDSYQLMIKIK